MTAADALTPADAPPPHPATRTRAPAAPATRPAAGHRAGSAALSVAIDIGGTKIAGALVDRRGTLHATARRPTPPSTGRGPGAAPAGAVGAACGAPGAAAEAIMAAVTEVIATLARSPEWTRVTRCGLASAGPVDAARGTVSPVNITAWRDFPVHARAEAALARHGAPVPAVLVGDGVAMAAAEHWLGAARGRRNALCMVVSTGVGGGLILDGRLCPGPTGNAGHIGHISVEVDGAPCPCGSRGCVEALASGPAIARHAAAMGWRPAGADRSAAAVAAAAREGDPVALAAFDRAGRALAAAIAGTATLLEVEAAVIGGGVAAAGEVLFAPLRQHLATYAALSFVRGVEAVPAALGTDAGLVGAAAAAFELLPDPALDAAEPAPTPPRRA
ncbi:ROK family protein [Streptomyces buecherae]|uniref:ROK family protein n=1 Tax=Streptomyces buecherae TaxID=2763006 RepID=UPI0036D011B1